MTLNLDYQANTYLAVTLAQSSEYTSSPSSLSQLHPDVSYVGKVGALDDVQLVSVPKMAWESKGQDILSFLKEKDGISDVAVQELRQRSKRGGDEL